MEEKIFRNIDELLAYLRQPSNYADDDCILKLDWWNELCNHNYLFYNTDFRIFSNDPYSLNNRIKDADTALRMAHHGQYDYSHNWAQFSVSGNLRSAQNIEWLIDARALARAIFNYPEWFYNVKIVKDDDN